MDVQEMCIQRLGPPYENIVNGNMDELNQVTDKSHDSETDCDSLGNLNKFFSRGFCASNKKLVSLANKLLWYLNELLDFLGHYAKGTMKGRRVRVRWCVCVDRKVLF
jgi:hypothetical protein